jgi:hypothetical protein
LGAAAGGGSVGGLAGVIFFCGLVGASGIRRGGGGANPERDGKGMCGRYALHSAHHSVGASTDPLLHSACSETQVTVSVLGVCLLL